MSDTGPVGSIEPITLHGCAKTSFGCLPWAATGCALLVLALLFFVPLGPCVVVFGVFLFGYELQRMSAGEQVLAVAGPVSVFVLIFYLADLIRRRRDAKKLGHLHEQF